jgi:hypothetical protein
MRDNGKLPVPADSRENHQMELSTEDVERFRQRGYCVQPGFYDQASIKKISDWLDALRTTPPPEGAEACYYEQSPVTGEELLVRVEHILGEHNPEITRLMLTPKLLGAITDLLGEQPVLAGQAASGPVCRLERLYRFLRDHGRRDRRQSPGQRRTELSVHRQLQESADGPRMAATHRRRPALGTGQRL